MALLKALFWALIFILRIRFPPGTSIATVLKNNSAVFTKRQYNFLNERIKLIVSKSRNNLPILLIKELKSDIISIHNVNAA